jgi:hypothetical protein
MVITRKLFLVYFFLDSFYIQSHPNFTLFSSVKSDGIDFLCAKLFTLVHTRSLDFLVNLNVSIFIGVFFRGVGKFILISRIKLPQPRQKPCPKITHKYINLYYTKSHLNNFIVSFIIRFFFGKI